MSSAQDTRVFVKNTYQSKYGTRWNMAGSPVVSKFHTQRLWKLKQFFKKNDEFKFQQLIYLILTFIYFI